MNDYQHKQTEWKVYAIDFDGVVTVTGSYLDPLPNNENLARIRKLYYKGHIIIIWTARRWIEARWLVGWLISHDVPFHGLRMDKGGADVYVDDKMGELPERELPEEV